MDTKKYQEKHVSVTESLADASNGHWLKQLTDHFRNQKKKFPSVDLVVLLNADESKVEKWILDPFLKVLRWFQIQQNGLAGVSIERQHLDKSTLYKRIKKYGRNTRLNIQNDQFLVLNRGSKSEEPHLYENYTSNDQKVIGIIRLTEGNEQIRLHIDEREILHIDVGISAGEIGQKRFAAERLKKQFGLKYLIPESDLPESIIPCWHGINDPENLAQFIESDYTWGEVDVRISPFTRRLITRHDSHFISRFTESEQIQYFEHVLKAFKENGKKIKIDFKRGFWVVDRVIQLLDKHGFRDDMVWFHGSVRVLRVNGYRKLARRYPDALLQATVDRFVPLILWFPVAGKFIVDRLAGFGVNQYLLSWQSWYKDNIISKLNEWGYLVNLYKVRNLEEFLNAALFLPASITADFNFPEWGYYGRGSGQNMQWYEYPEN